MTNRNWSKPKRRRKRRQNPMRGVIPHPGGKLRYMASRASMQTHKKRYAFPENLRYTLNKIPDSNLFVFGLNFPDPAPSSLKEVSALLAPFRKLLKKLNIPYFMFSARAEKTGRLHVHGVLQSNIPLFGTDDPAAPKIMPTERPPLRIDYPKDNPKT